MNPTGHGAVGSTPVPDSWLDDLIPTYISTLGELYEAEEANIAAATIRRSPTVKEILDDVYLRKLHEAMFSKVWRWAGTQRRLLTNIGIDPTQVSGALRDLTLDTSTWVEHTTYAPDEIAVRFHHRIVQIHPFVNGNGRHGRIAADYLATALGRPPFTWGAGAGLDTTSLRARYHCALQKMDRNRKDIEDLLAFARA